MFLQKVRTLQELRDLSVSERRELLISKGDFTDQEADDVEVVLQMMPVISLDVTCETEGEEGIQQGDIVTMRAWVSLSRGNGLIVGHPHAPYFPYHKDETYWVLLADTSKNFIWVSQRVSFLDEAAGVLAASKSVQESMEGTGASDKEVNAAVKEAVSRVKSGSRLVVLKFQAPMEGNYNLTAFCLSDTWISCDKKVSVKLKVSKRSRAGTRSIVADDGAYAEDGLEDEEEEMAYDEDYESEYSDEEGEGEPKKADAKKGSVETKQSSEDEESEDES
jgi:translocation protein SEC63